MSWRSPPRLHRRCGGLGERDGIGDLPLHRTGPRRRRRRWHRYPRAAVDLAGRRSGRISREYMGDALVLTAVWGIAAGRRQLHPSCLEQRRRSGRRGAVPGPAGDVRCRPQCAGRAVRVAAGDLAAEVSAARAS